MAMSCAETRLQTELSQYGVGFVVPLLIKQQVISEFCILLNDRVITCSQW